MMLEVAIMMFLVLICLIFTQHILASDTGKVILIQKDKKIFPLRILKHQILPLAGHTLQFILSEDRYEVKDLKIIDNYAITPLIKKTEEPVTKCLKKMVPHFFLPESGKKEYEKLLHEAESKGFNIHNNNFVVRLLDTTLKLKTPKDRTLSHDLKDNNFAKMIKAIQKNDHDLTQQCFFNINQDDYGSLTSFTPFIKNRCAVFLDDKNIDLVGFYFFELIPMKKRFIELRERCFNAMIGKMIDKKHITLKDKDYLLDYYKKKINPLILAQDFASNFDKAEEDGKNYTTTFDTKKYFLEFYSIKENTLYKYVDEADVVLYHNGSKSYVAIPTFRTYGNMNLDNLGDNKIFCEDPEKIWSYYKNIKKFFIQNWHTYQDEHKDNFGNNFTNKWNSTRHASLKNLCFAKIIKDKYFDIIMYDFLTKNSIETICSYKYKTQETLIDSQDDISNEPSIKYIHTMHTLLNEAAGKEFMGNNKHNSFYTILKHFYSHYFEQKTLYRNAQWLHKCIEKSTGNK